MSACGPWKHGPNTASQSRKALEQLPATTQGVTLLDPYYYDHTMTYSDDSYREGNTQLFTYGYRLLPCGVFALNFDPRKEHGAMLVESVICVVCAALICGDDRYCSTRSGRKGCPGGGLRVRDPSLGNSSPCS